MFYFLLFIYNGLFVLAIGASYFLIKEYKRVKNDNRLLLFFYFLLGFIFFIYEFFIAFYNTNLTFFFSLLSLYVFFIVIYSDRKSVFLILPLATIGTFFNFFNQGTSFLNSFTFAIFNFLIIFAVTWLITYSGINYFKKQSKTRNITFAIFFYLIILVAFISIYEVLFSSFIVDDILLLLLFEALIFTLFTFMISYVFILIDLLYLNYFNLSKNLFDKKQSYYKMALWRKELNKKIFTEKINYGALMFLEIDDKNLDNLKLKNFLEMFNMNLNKEYRNVFYFRSSSLYYSFFISMDEDDVDLEKFYKNNNLEIRNFDFFSNLEKILANMNNEIKKKTYISLYGIDSSNIDDLIKNNEYLIFEDTKANWKYPIQIFDYRTFRHSLVERFELSNYMEKYDKLNIHYYLNFSSKKIYLYNILITKGDKKFYLDSLDEELSNEEYTYLLRFSSLMAIKNFNKDDFDYLILKYPINFLMKSDFNFVLFKEKITKNFNYPITKILIGFEIKNFKEKEKFEQLSSFLKEFERNGLRYAILDKQNYLEEYDNYLKPIIKIEHKEHKITDRLFDLSFI